MTLATGIRPRKQPPAEGTLGARLYRARYVRGYTLEYVAQLASMDRTTYNRWELNTYTPTDVMSLVRVAYVLQVSFAYLIGLQPNMGVFEWPKDYERKFMWSLT